LFLFPKAFFNNQRREKKRNPSPPKGGTKGVFGSLKVQATDLGFFFSSLRILFLPVSMMLLLTILASHNVPLHVHNCTLLQPNEPKKKKTNFFTTLQTPLKATERKKKEPWHTSLPTQSKPSMNGKSLERAANT
jgi:hypothetical protein